MSKNIWDDMDMTGWTSGLTAVDEDTYRKKVIEEEDLVRADKPALVAKDDLTSLEQRLERKLDSLRNMEKKVDTLLSLIYDNDAIVEERKQLADSVANQKVNEMAKIVMPLLNSLYRTQNQEYIHWPGRGPIIQKQMEKVEKILSGEFFNEKQIYNYHRAIQHIEKDYPVPTKDVDKLAEMLYDNTNKTLIEKEK